MKSILTAFDAGLAILTTSFQSSRLGRIVGEHFIAGEVGCATVDDRAASHSILGHAWTGRDPFAVPVERRREGGGRCTEHTLTTVIEDGSGATFHCLARSPNRPGFNVEQIDAFHQLSHHINRAAGIRAQIRNAHAADQPADPLDAVKNAIFLITSDAVLVRANAAGLALLREADAISEKGGVLNVAGRTPLRQLIASLTNSRQPSVQAFPIRRGGLQAILNRAPRSWGSDDLLALIVSDPRDAVLPSVEMLRQLFDLTATEAWFARTFLQVKSVNGAAESMGIRPETGRRHIKSIFEKTGAHSQVELTSLLLLHPLALLDPAG